MTIYVLRRLALAVPTLLGVSLVAFAMINLSGDPSTMLLPHDASDEARAEFRRALGLDRPLPVQYAAFLVRALQGDFGNSLAYREPALAVLARRIPATVALGVTAVLAAVVIAVPVGTLAALRRGRLADYVGLTTALVGQSIPTFWLGMVLILVFAVRLKVFPVSGAASWQHLILPAVTVAFWELALLVRVTRASVLEAMSLDYVRTARAKGLGERTVVSRHILRNALLPIVTVIGLDFGNVLSGAVVTEIVFAWPGVGTLLIDAVLHRDYPIVVTTVVVGAAAFVLINLVVDLLYVYLDPRIRLGARQA